MKILHLDGGHDWAGGQNQVRLLMRELARRGIEQSCCCPRGSALARRLLADGLPVREIAWSGGADPRAVLALVAPTRSCDIVHCHDAHALQIAWLPARLWRKQLVAARRVHFRTSAFKWNSADAVIAISAVVENALIESGVDRSRIHRIASGVDPAEINALPPLSLPAHGFRIATIGKLSEYKGQTIIPETAVLLRDIDWLVIGDGPLRGVIESAIRDLGVADRVRMLGTVEDARRVLRELDLFVFTSPDEPLGTSVLDAMAAGVPVVAANAAGGAEILGPVHALTGTSLYAPGDARGLAGVIARLQTDASQRRLMVQAQRDRLSAFTIAATADKTIELYRSLLAAR